MRNPDPLRAAARHSFSLPSSDLLYAVSELMGSEGKFQLILPYAEGNVFIAEAREYVLYCNSILKIRPTLNSTIKRMILRFSRNRHHPVEKFLTIQKGGRGDYTDDYRELTKDFYLKF